MASQVILPKDFDIARISYSAPKQLDSGGRSIFVNYNGGPLIVQTPEMHAPFGISVWNNERTGLPEKYNLDVSFKGLEARDSLQRFFGMLQELDKRFVADAMDNSMQWFKKRFPSLDVVEALYTPLIKHAKDKVTGEVTDAFPPTFKMGLPFKDGAFRLDGVFDTKRTKVDLMDVVGRDGRGKNSRVRAIIQCSGVWVAGGKFGCTWRVKQLIIDTPPALDSWAFLPDESGTLLAEDGDEDIETSTTSAKRGGTARAGAAAHKTQIDTSDDDDTGGRGRGAADAFVDGDD